MDWKKEFEKYEADGIDFVALGFDPRFTSFKLSFSKESFLKGAKYPRSNYYFWKIKDGKKYYLNLRD